MSNPERWVQRRHTLAVTLAAALAIPASASAHTRPDRPPPSIDTFLRPTFDFASWIGLGGGAIVGASDTAGVFDLRVGGDATLAIGRKGDLRIGPFVEAASSTFASLQAVGGVELFVGAIPRPLRMFYYSGEGVLSVRVGAGWAWRRASLPAADSVPVTSLTLAYGYRAPFSLREYTDPTGQPGEIRPVGRYMTGARLWTNATVDSDDAHAWQLTGGIEFEPVGTFRYLLGLY